MQRASRVSCACILAVALCLMRAGDAAADDGGDVLSYPSGVAGGGFTTSFVNAPHGLYAYRTTITYVRSRWLSFDGGLALVGLGDGLSR
ncbi:MAG: hypothetical protein AAB426_11750 [Myxococcota bacterium]